METSSVRASLVLACGTEVVAREEFTSERSQEVDLFDPLKQLLSHLPEESHLSWVVIGTGPGSYNGARVGIAAAQAVAQVHGAQVNGLCSFEGVEGLGAGRSWAVGDARRGSFFILELENGRLLEGIRLLDREDFLSELESFGGQIVTFEKAERLALPQALATKVREVEPDAAQLLTTWLGMAEEEKQHLAGQPLEAFYLREPHITQAKGK